MLKSINDLDIGTKIHYFGIEIQNFESNKVQIINRKNQITVLKCLNSTITFPILGDNFNYKLIQNK